MQVFLSSLTLIVDFLQHPKLPSIHFCFQTKVFSFYVCLFAILFQAIFAFTFSKGEGGPLSTDKRSGGSKPEKVVGKPVSKGKLPSTSNKLSLTMSKKSAEMANVRTQWPRKTSQSF